MDINKSEVDAVSSVESDLDQIKALTELELLLVGGGQGDVSFG